MCRHTLHKSNMNLIPIEMYIVHKEFYGNSHFISTKVESDYGRRLKMAMDIICQYDFKLHFCEYSYAEFTFRFELHNFVYKICSI